MKVYISLIQLFKRLPRYANCDVTCIFSVTGHHGIWLEGSMARSCEYSFRPLGSATAGEKWADPGPGGRWKRNQSLDNGP